MNDALEAIKHQDTVQSMMQVVSGRWVGAERTSSMSPLLAELYGRVYDLDLALQGCAKGQAMSRSDLPAHVATVDAVGVVLNTGKAAARLLSERKGVEILQERVGNLRTFLQGHFPTPLAMAS